MRHETPTAGPVAARVAGLNDRYRNHAAIAVLRHALADPAVGRVALVSSFGAESVVLLHMISVLDRDTPVLFIDTQMLFAETLAYQAEVAAQLGLGDVRTIRAHPEAAAAHDPDRLLHKTDPDACCALRKTAPLERALAPFDAWITGRKRFQGETRASLDFFENEGDRRIKVNPLAHWRPADVQDYMVNNRLPRHPLVARGYPSIGCAPCTSRVAAGEDPRAGRWRGQGKEECGIHFVGGRIVRTPAADDSPQHQEEPAMNVIVTDTGFAADDRHGDFAPLAETGATAIDLDPDADLSALVGRLDEVEIIRIAFAAFSDGRGFTLARRLRMMGFAGRLRAAGHVIADQYAMARRAGFDEVEISADLARRQPWEQWQARADWCAHDYQARLRGAG